ncbi:MAG: protein TolQ [Maricaulaceae bacterium]
MQLPVGEAAIAAELAAPEAAEFTLLALFLKADIVVKIVMGSLVAASVWSWGVVIDKQFMFLNLRARARRFEDVFWSGRTLDELSEALAERPGDPLAKVFRAAMREYRDARSRPASDAQVLSQKERIDRVMGLTVTRELSRVENGLGVLASIGSSAPFIGLFGTVWGIMNSFRSIALSQDTNLAVVAPGLAEALFATALGLVAAIPAVIFYNKFATDLARYAVRVESYADELSAILSRRLTERSV